MRGYRESQQPSSTMAVFSAIVTWVYFESVPWTRDAKVRAQVASIAPLVSGQIIQLMVSDNQFVHVGDVLYVIDPFDFEIAVDSAKADLKNKEADLEVKNAQARRREQLSILSTSLEEKQQFVGSAKIAEAACEGAKAQLAQAEENLKRTEVRATVNGFVTNLLLRVGDYARAGVTNVSLVDADSFWVDAYFEETKMASVHVGDFAEVALMGFSPPLPGRVESITRGIATPNASASTQGLPNVDPVYTWVRLAQRVPVRIRILRVPGNIHLVAGITASVTITDANGRQ
jgi:RND family efflux transporter MFP subunit